MTDPEVVQLLEDIVSASDSNIVIQTGDTNKLITSDDGEQVLVDPNELDFTEGLQATNPGGEQVSVEVEDGEITSAKLENDSITQEKIATDAIGNQQLQDDSVDTPELVTSAVDTDKVSDLAITTDKIGNQEVTGTKIASDAIGVTQLDLTISPIWANGHTFSVGLTSNDDIVLQNSSTVTGLDAPTSSTDAATKAYVDGSIEGLVIKDSVRVSTDSNIDLTSTSDPGQIDGVTLNDGDRILLRSQSTASENGIYVANTATDPSTWSRSTDLDEDSEAVPGVFTFVEEGTNRGDTSYVITSDEPLILGSSNIVWSQFSSAGAITAGDGLVKTGQQLSVDEDYSFDFTSTVSFEAGIDGSGSAIDVGNDLDLSGNQLEDSNNNYLQISSSENLRIGIDQAIEDDTGTSRLGLSSSVTSIYDESGIERFIARSGDTTRVQPDANSNWSVFDDEGGFQAYQYSTSSSTPGVIELTNANVDGTGQTIAAQLATHSTNINENLTIPQDRGTVIAGPLTGSGTITGDGTLAVVQEGTQFTDDVNAQGNDINNVGSLGADEVLLNGAIKQASTTVSSGGTVDICALSASNSGFLLISRGANIAIVNFSGSTTDGKVLDNNDNFGLSQGANRYNVYAGNDTLKFENTDASDRDVRITRIG